MYCPRCGVEAVSGARFCQSCGYPTPDFPERLHNSVTARPEATNITVAGFWERFSARMLDSVLTYIAAIPLMLIVGFPFYWIRATNDPEPLWAGLAILAAWFVAWVSYYSILHGAYGQTIGKILLGVKVTEVSGKPISYGRALVRSIAEILSVIPLSVGYLIAVFNPRRRALHDFISGTVVVRTRPLTNLDVAIIIFAVLVFGIGSVGVMAATAIPQFKSYRLRGYDALVKSEIRNAAVAEESFFALKGSKYTTNLSLLELEGWKRDANVRIVILPGKGGLEKNYVIIGRHIQSKNAFLFDGSTGQISDVTLKEVHDAGISGIGP